MTEARGSGERYGRLLLIYRDAGRTADGRVKSLWRCDCGADAVIAYGRVKGGATVSCGCFAREKSAARATTHGGKSSPEYVPWTAMKRRCEDIGDKDYPRYGGRGIRVCALWSSSFAAFLADVGPRPKGTTLDRIDGRRGYEPGNVRWATPTQQARNRRSSLIWNIKGEVFQSIADAAVAFGVSEHTISRWVNGAFDKRRNSMTPARQDCHAVERYT